MTDPTRRPSSPVDVKDAEWHVLRVRRRSYVEWLAWVLWLLGLAVLLEYALASFDEQEPQAGVLALGLFIGLLFTGIIIELVRAIEARSAYRDPDAGPPPDDDQTHDL